MFVCGLRLYGRCDLVPGRFYVATQFLHVFFLPLVPVGSYLVLREHARGFEGIRIPLSGQSVLWAWGRALLWLPGVIALLAILYNLYCLPQMAALPLEKSSRPGAGDWPRSPCLH